jgi:hypothetical protein
MKIYTQEKPDGIYYLPMYPDKDYSARFKDQEFITLLIGYSDFEEPEPNIRSLNYSGETSILAPDCGVVKIILK